MSPFPPPTTAPAGWYPDPDGREIARYFDGRAWHEPLDAAGFDAPVHDRFGPPRPPHPELPIAAATGALAILLVSLVGGRLLVDLLIGFGWPVLVYVAILTTVGYGPSVWWCWFVSRRWGSGSLGADIGLRFRWSDIGWGPLVWVSAVLCQIVVAAVVLTTGLPTSSNTEGIAEVDADRSYVIALLITAVIAAPFVEEMVFRGVVLRGLLGRLGAVVTIALQSVLFGMAHIDPVRGAGNLGLVVILSGVGAALGVATFLFRRLGPAIVGHALFNGVVLTIVLTGLADRLQERLDESVAVGHRQAEVVDQSHTAHPHRQHQQRVLVDAGGRRERAPIDHRHVLDVGRGLVAQRPHHAIAHHVTGGLALGHQRPGHVEGSGDATRGVA